MGDGAAAGGENGFWHLYKVTSQNVDDLEGRANVF